MATEIISGLWISNEESALNETFLDSKHIKVIINVSEDIPFVNKKRYVCHRLAINDNPAYTGAEDNFMMYNAFLKIVDYIHECLTKQINVLVHCHAGKQRSATLVCAYIMKYAQVPMVTAIKYIRSKRDICFTPDANFSDALRKYEKML